MGHMTALYVKAYIILTDLVLEDKDEDHDEVYFHIRQISNTSGTKSQHFNVFRLVLQLSLCSILEPDKSRKKI